MNQKKHGTKEKASQILTVRLEKPCEHQSQLSGACPGLTKIKPKRPNANVPKPTPAIKWTSGSGLNGLLTKNILDSKTQKTGFASSHLPSINCFSCFHSHNLTSVFFKPHTQMFSSQAAEMCVHAISSFCLFLLFAPQLGDHVFVLRRERNPPVRSHIAAKDVSGSESQSVT